MDPLYKNKKQDLLDYWSKSTFQGTHVLWPLLLMSSTIFGAGLVGIVLNGDWLLLLLPIVILVISSVCSLLKRSYWKGFDPMLDRAAETARPLAFAFWTALTWWLDWMLESVSLVVAVTLALNMSHDPSGHHVLTVAWGAAMLTPPYFAFSTSDGTTTRWRYILGVVATILTLLSMFAEITTLRCVLFCLAVSPAYVAIRAFAGGRSEVDSYRRKRNKAAAYAKSGGPKVVPDPPRKIFHPRPGVLFELPYNSYFWIPPELWYGAIHDYVTILRIETIPFLCSLSLFVAACVMLFREGCGTRIWLWPVVASLGWLLHNAGDTDLQKDSPARRKGVDVDLAVGQIYTRMILHAFGLFAVGALVWWLGGTPVAIFATAGLFASAYASFTAYVVLASDSISRDPLDFFFVAFGLAVCAGLLARPDAPWYCLFAAASGEIIRLKIRRWFPRSGLRGLARRTALRDQDKLMKLPDEPELKPDRMLARMAKRERQLAALRRSQGRAVEKHGRDVLSDAAKPTNSPEKPIFALGEQARWGIPQDVWTHDLRPKLTVMSIDFLSLAASLAAWLTVIVAAVVLRRPILLLVLLGGYLLDKIQRDQESTFRDLKENPPKEPLPFKLEKFGKQMSVLCTMIPTYKMIVVFLALQFGGEGLLGELPRFVGWVLLFACVLPPNTLIRTATNPNVPDFAEKLATYFLVLVWIGFSLFLSPSQAALYALFAVLAADIIRIWCLSRRSSV